jgi:hypothetical protein
MQLLKVYIVNLVLLPKEGDVIIIRIPKKMHSLCGARSYKEISINKKRATFVAYRVIDDTYNMS